MLRSRGLRSAASTIVLLAMLAVPLGSCSTGGSGSGYFVGDATYWVEFYDWVIDWTGKRQQAFCARFITFRGDIDGRCSQLPMVWSFARNAWMDCVYTDRFGDVWWYTDLYYFGSGYIQEPACFDDYFYPLAADNPDRYQVTRLERNEDDELVIDESIELGDERLSVSDLRELARERLDVPSEAGSGDEPVTVRTGEVTSDDPDAAEYLAE